MRAETIKYTGFRNIKNGEIRLSDGINVFFGKNAQGKTNALEGIYMFAHGKSFRTQNDRDLIAFGESRARLELEFSNDDRKRELSFELYKTKRRECKINKAPAKIGEVLGLFRAVLFCPDHLSLVKEGPAARRSFLNSAICQLKPVYLRSLQRYNHILEQRNILIKKSEDHPEKYKDVIDLYSEQLATEAAYIYTVRRDYIKALSKYVEVFFDGMGNGEKVSLSYKNSLKSDEYYDLNEIKSIYLELFNVDRAREIAVGATLHGIHRDDIEIYLSGKEARIFASQGQQRSIALALKLAEGEISKDETGEYPVFLFDDVLSELDSGRQKIVTDTLPGSQVIITACDISGFDEKILSRATLTEVVDGCYEIKE